MVSSYKEVKMPKPVKISKPVKNHYLLNFKKNEPGRKGKTKFGGQPDWYQASEWPLSKEYGEPMQFICQIELEAIGFGNYGAKYAYLFMSGMDLEADETWEADGGENAIILQPGDNSRFKVRKITKGPSISDEEEAPEGCHVELQLSRGEQTLKDEQEGIATKLAGEPNFLQGANYPFNSKSRVEMIDGKEVETKEEWHLLLQLYEFKLPYLVNFGAGGIGYGFIRNDGKMAKFFWQC